MKNDNYNHSKYATHVLESKETTDVSLYEVKWGVSRVIHSNKVTRQ